MRACCGEGESFMGMRGWPRRRGEGRLRCKVTGSPPDHPSCSVSPHDKTVVPQLPFIEKVLDVAYCSRTVGACSIDRIRWTRLFCRLEPISKWLYR
jgi:hypothetical protein